jgi:predicted transcriptional regulator
MKTKKHDEIEKRFIEIYKTKLVNINELSKELGVNRATLHRWIKKHFPDLSHEKRKALLFTKLYHSGIFTIDDMALLLSMTKTSVLRFIRQLPETEITEKELLKKKQKGKRHKPQAQSLNTLTWGGVSKKEVEKCAKMVFPRVRKG